MAFPQIIIEPILVAAASRSWPRSRSTSDGETSRSR